VAERDVELAVGTEGELSSVVLGPGISGEEELPSRAGYGPGAVLRGAVLEDVVVPVPPGVVDVEQAVGREAGVEGDREQALLSAPREHEPVDVQERLRQQLPLDRQPDRPPPGRAPTP